MTRRFCLCVFLSWLCLLTPALGAEVSFLVGAERFNKPVTSLRDIRRQHVVLQALDFSCGAAALATVLRYGFAEEVNEVEIIGYIFIFGQTPAEGYKKYFKRQGFTLLDLKRAARAKGYQGKGYKNMNLDELLEFIEGEHVPVLVPIRPMGYNHFVVVRGVAGNRILVSDPARGNSSMTVRHFLDVWIDGIGFVIYQRETADAGTHVAGRETSDPELDRITAAGAIPAVASEEDRPSRALLTAKATDPPLAMWRLQSFLQPTSLFEFPNAPMFPNAPQNTFQNADGVNLITIFSVKHFNGFLQLGQPAGNFTDFSQSH
jgi:predicted double-glycine peptidase